MLQLKYLLNTIQMAIGDRVEIRDVSKEIIKLFILRLKDLK